MNWVNSRSGGACYDDSTINTAVAITITIITRLYDILVVLRHPVYKHFGWFLGWRVFRSKG